MSADESKPSRPAHEAADADEPERLGSLRRCVNGDDTLRIVTVECAEPLRELCERCEIDGLEAVVLGRAMVAGYLMATVAKNEHERMRVQLRGEGPVGTVIVDTHGDGRGRAALQARLPEALARRPVEAGRVSIGPFVGESGFLTVTRDLGLARPYQGTVELVSGELDEDLEAYLSESEQLPSTLRCVVQIEPDGSVVGAAGVLVQTFPGSDPAEVDAARERLRDGRLEALDLRRVTHAELAHAAVGETGYRVVHEHSLRFDCPCGPENARRVVSTLGAEDLEALAREQETTEVRCNFCGRVTVLDASDLRDVASQIRAANPNVASAESSS